MSGPRGEVVLDIEGMTCVSCVDRLERVLAKQPGVTAARVSLALRTASVQSDQAVPDLASLVAAVERAGYRAAPHKARRPAGADLRVLQRRLAAAAFFTSYVLIFSFLVNPHTPGSMRLAWLFATPVQFYGGWPFLLGAWRSARHGVHTMDTLVAAGSLAAYAYSVMAVVTGTHHAHFDTAAVIVTLILVGRVLEARARKAAGNAARLLLERQPSTATLLGADGRERTVDRADLQVGDKVVVRPGEQLPADGVVLAGTSSVDLSVLTGESVPEDVGPGDAVVGASINGQGRVVVELTCVGEETRLGQIVSLLERTQASKAPIQRVADRVASVCVPWVLVTAAAVFCLRWVGSADLAHSLMYAAAVLLVACPCSLGLATPAAIMVGSGRAAELGILFKGGEVFEAAKRIDAVLIDKTGTLTEGRMSLTTVVGHGTSEADVLALAAAAEAGSEHPFARAVLAAAEERDIVVPAATDHRAEPGAGITARVGEGVGARFVRVGRPEGLPAALDELAGGLAAKGLMVVGVWVDGEVAGLLGASDTVKAGAAHVVGRIRKWGRTVEVVSGDRRAAVVEAARQAGIDVSVAEVFPDGKVAEVKRLQAEGKRVAFVGDGVNDAPALAQADLGIALGTGTDIAIEAADVLIMGGDLGLVADCLELAGRTYWVIVQNLVWAFAYNSLMIPLAVVGRVSPLMAAATMAGSSWTVVSNALRLQRFRGAAGRAAAATGGDLEPDLTPLVVALDEPPAPAGVDPVDARHPALATLGRMLARQWDH